MNPDETQLALWLDDEMSGDELTKMDAWAVSRPELLQQRQDLRDFRNQIASIIPASEALPFSDFFMARIQQGIRESATNQPKNIHSLARWKTWLMPMAACAGMVLAFSLGRGTRSDETVLATTPTPSLYTPEEGISAEWIAGSKSKPAVILLEGVSAIPNSTDFSETVYVPTHRESDNTATHQQKNSDFTEK